LIAGGQLKVGTPETKFVLGKVFLAGFMACLNTPDFKDALAIARHG